MVNRITMQDIANKVGVSKVTVSKALSGKEDISSTMRDKIIEVAEDIGYLYNSKGKMLKENLTYSIGVVASDKYFGQDDHFYVELYKFLSEEMEKLNYTPMFHILKVESENNLSLPRMLLEQKIDGIIILGQLKKEYIQKILNCNFPVVFLDFYYDTFNVDSIITDSFFATYEITNFLIEKGHTEIAYVGNLNTTSSIQDRFLGYYKSLLEHRLDLNKNWIINDRSDENEFIEIQLPEELPTAFVCNCDKTAFKLINTLNKYGYKVPKDFSVVGFDDSIEARICNPQITTVRVDLSEMAKMAVKILSKKIKNNEKNYGRILIKGKIIKRASVREK